MNKIIIKGNKVTFQEVENAISKKEFIKMGLKKTICHLTLIDGFEVIGSAGIVNPEDFNMEIGSKIAYENALDQVWSHMGSILQDRLLN